MEIKNLKKFANRLKKAITNKERIILYGDADLDGITSLIIVKESIKSLGGQVAEVYFPDREKEGYGLTELALDQLKKWSPSLLVLLDCGITSFKETELAKSMGFEIVIIDHHEVLEKMPKASIIVDPKQKGDKYPFKGLATAGLAYKLAEVILGGKLSDALRNNFLELTALATIADMMPQEADNKTIIEEGLFCLEKTYRPGLAAFLEMYKSERGENIRLIAHEIASTLNIAEQRNHLNTSYLLLSADSVEEAKVLAAHLLEKREQKRSEVKIITAQVEELISKKQKEPIVFEESSDWPLAPGGSIASIICNKYEKPTFIISKKEEESRGAVRVPRGIDSVALMKKCSKYLLSFGGHAPASGFRIKNENLGKFKKCLIENLTHA